MDGITASDFRLRMSSLPGTSDKCNYVNDYDVHVSVLCIGDTGKLSCQ